MLTSSLAWRYATLARLTGNPSELTSEMTFWANGPRGHCHGDKRCRRRKKGNPVAVTATPQSVAGRACPDCFIPTLIAKMPAAVALYELIGICATSEPHAKTATTDGMSLDALHNAVLGLMHAARRLGYQIASPEAENAYGTEMTRIQGDIRTAMAAARTRMHALRDELVTPVALAIMRPTSNISPELQPTAAELIVLGDNQGSYQRNSQFLFQTWADSVHGQRTVEHQERRLADGAAGITLKSVDQLRGVPAVPADGLTADQAAIQAWTIEKDKIVNRLHVHWNETLNTLVADDSIELVALGGSRLSGGALASTVIEAYAVARRDRASVTVVRVPGTVARWLSMQYRPAASQFDAARHAGDAQQDVIETAIALWDENDRRSPYRRFSACITAAQALMAS